MESNPIIASEAVNAYNMTASRVASREVIKLMKTSVLRKVLEDEN